MQHQVATLIILCLPCVLVCGTITDPIRADTRTSGSLQFVLARPIIEPSSTTPRSSTYPQVSRVEMQRARQEWLHQLARAIARLSPHTEATKVKMRPTSSVPNGLPHDISSQTTISSKGARRELDKDSGRMFSLAVARVLKARAGRRKLIKALQHRQLVQKSVSPDASNTRHLAGGLSNMENLFKFKRTGELFTHHFDSHNGMSNDGKSHRLAPSDGKLDDPWRSFQGIRKHDRKRRN